MTKKKIVRLTGSQMEALAPYEKNMLCAVKSDYTRGLGRKGLTIMADIYKTVTKSPYFLNLSCNFCCTDLVRWVGRLYFGTKEAAEDSTEDKAVETQAPQKKLLKSKNSHD